MARRNINSFSAADRALLARLISQFATDAVVSMHRNMQGIHGGDPMRFLGFHREYVRRLERWLVAQGFRRFVPLPEWNPTQCVPLEFRRGINNPCPRVSFAQFAGNNRANFASESDFGRQLEARHNIVHNRLGGAMARVMTSPSVPIFWLWHAFVDDLWFEYVQFRNRRSISAGGETRSFSTNRPRSTGRRQPVRRQRRRR